MEKYKGFKYKGFEGIDVDLETSLFEQGLIWKKGHVGHEKDYHFIYGVKHNGMEYTHFDWADIAIDADIEKEWAWADFDSVAKFAGMAKEEFLKMELPLIVFDLIAYYGHEEIFGGSYYPFEVK